MMSDAFSSKMRGGLDACNRMMRRCYTCSANLPCLDASNSSKRNDFLDLLLCAWMHNAVSAISLSLLAQVTSPAHPCHDVKKFLRFVCPSHALVYGSHISIVIFALEAAWILTFFFASCVYHTYVSLEATWVWIVLLRSMYHQAPASLEAASM